MATALEAPVLKAAVSAATAAPNVEETESGGAPTTEYAPGKGREWPAVVLLNGATPLGRHHPAIVRLAHALSRAGYLVLVPDVPGVALGEVTAEGLESAVASALDVSSRPSARQGRVALLGVSTGTTLALLAAEEPELAERVTVVAGITGYTDLADLIRLATTGVYREGEAIRAYSAGSFLSLCVGRSVCAGLAPGPDRDALLAELEAVGVEDPDPLAGVRARDTSGLGEEARELVALLANSDPARFDELYAALTNGARRKIERLSPVVRADRLSAPVELLFDPRDKYFPLEHARALVGAAPHARLTLSEALAHADTRFSLQSIGEIGRLVRFVTRVLETARFG